MEIDHKTRLNLVIGFPLAHTLSPRLHNAAYQLLAINSVFLACPMDAAESAIQAIRSLSVELAAVTMPLKEKVIPFLDVQSPEVHRLQAANTIIQRDGKLYGYNTDINGIAYAMRAVSLSGKNVLLLGAGGAARSAAYVLKKNDATIYYLNRTEAKANVLAEQFGGQVIHERQLDALSLDVMINATPLGMAPGTHLSPLPDYPFESHHVIFDMVYNPVETVLVRHAKKRGATVLSGLDMFIGQALAQIELLTHQPILTEEKVAALKAHLCQHE